MKKKDQERKIKGKILGENEEKRQKKIRKFMIKS